MKSFRVFILFFLLLTWSSVHSEVRHATRDLSHNSISEQEHSGFEAGEFTPNQEGDLPAAQVFFNLVPRLPFSGSASDKVRKTIPDLLLAKLNPTSGQTYFPISIFNRYCSVYVRIYLNTACFRL